MGSSIGDIWASTSSAGIEFYCREHISDDSTSRLEGIYFWISQCNTGRISDLIKIEMKQKYGCGH